MKFALPFMLLILMGYCPVAAQRKRAAVVDIGINTATLWSGLPEVQGGWFINRYLGIVGAAGYTFRPVRGGVKVDDYKRLESLHGFYWKIGIKGRMVFNRKKSPVPWAQLLYIGSNYDETGSQGYDSSYQVAYRPFHNRGFVGGLALAVGMDVPMGRHLCFRFGGQVGHANTKGRRGVNDFQPGFGADAGEAAISLNLGFSYGIGDRRAKKFFGR